MPASYVRPTRVGAPGDPADGNRARTHQATSTEGSSNANPTRRNIRRTLLAIGVTLIVLPAAISDGHQLTPQQAKVVHHSR